MVNDGMASVGRAVLVTGAARAIGAAIVAALAAEPGVDRVIGVDTLDPRPVDGDGKVELRQIDLLTPTIAKTIADYEPDTVVHLGVDAEPRGAGGRAAMKERNVIGTMQLLAACQKASSVRRLVVRSSAAVYGTAPRDPALFTEETEPHRPPRSGYGKDMTEIEGYVRGFARRRPDVAVSVLRFATVLGPGVRNQFTAYLRRPVLPTVVGYDPRLQFLHVDDAVEALRLAVLGGGGQGAHPGTYNVAGDGVLLLSQIVRRLGRATLPMPPFGSGFAAQALRRLGFTELVGDQLALLTYGRVLDTSRMRDRLGLRPAYTTASALAAHIDATGSRGPVPLDAIAKAERALREELARRSAGRNGG